MNKKILKIGAFILAIVLIIGVGLFANSLVGNPISKAIAKNTAEKYIKENYGNTDCKLESISYSFKDEYYHAHVSSESSIDTHFSLLINGLGQLKYDNYESSVTNGWNTAQRIGMDYRKVADEILKSKQLPYNMFIAYGELIFTHWDAETEENGVHHIPSYALITDELTLDGYYNVNKLGADAGKITVYIADSMVSVERMSEILLDIRMCFDDAGVGFHAIDCVLEYPRDENGFAEDGRIEVMDFLYSDIYEEGLTDRIEESNKAAMEYYNDQDLEKYVEK